MAKQIYRATAMQVPVYTNDLPNLEEYKRAFSEVAKWSGGWEQWSRLRPIGLKLESGVTAQEGDWIVKIDGEFKVMREWVGKE